MRSTEQAERVAHVLQQRVARVQETVEYTPMREEQQEERGATGREKEAARRLRSVHKTLIADLR